MITTPIACVVDASVGIKLVLSEPDSHLAHALFAHLDHDPAATMFVPDFFYLECANVLWQNVQSQKMTSSAAEGNFKTIRNIRLQPLPVDSLSDTALLIAIQFAISVYDAAYVAAAKDRNVPLITADGKLERKLTVAGIPLPCNVFLLSKVVIPSLAPPPVP